MSILVDQYPHSRAFAIVELPIPQRPEEGGEAEQAKEKGNRDQQAKTDHFAAPFKRSALAMTISEDVDMATAATSGVTLPATASGTASTL